MKTSNYLNIQRGYLKEKLYIFFLTCFFPVCMYGQVGNTLQNPIVVGTFGSSFHFMNPQNTINFTNDFSVRYNSPNDVFYKFTITVPMEITLSHCDSSLDTYVYLLDGNGSMIAYNDDFSENGCTSRYFAYLKKILSAGTYYVISEGYSANGLIHTTIQGETDLPGKTLQNPIIVTFNTSSSLYYVDSQNTDNFTNGYTMRSPKDVFYKFTLPTKMEVQISHCGSLLSDTYLHLLDEGGNRIAYNDDSSVSGCENRYLAYIKKTLSAGIYYVVSEGYSSSGEITTTIEGCIPSVSFYYDSSGNRVFRDFSSFLHSSNLRSAFQYEEKTEAGVITGEEFNDNKIEILGNDKVAIAPNPTKGLLTVEVLEYEHSLQGKIRILSMEGKVLQEQELTSVLTQFDLTEYPAGLYLMKIQLNGEMKTYKILKK